MRAVVVVIAGTLLIYIFAWFGLFAHMHNMPVCVCASVCLYVRLWRMSFNVCGGVNWKTMTTRQAPSCSNWNLATQIPHWMAKCNWNNFEQWRRGVDRGGVDTYNRYAANTWTHTCTAACVCVYYDLTLNVYAGLVHTPYPARSPLSLSAIYLAMYCCLCWSIVFTCGFHAHTHAHTQLIFTKAQ